MGPFFLERSERCRQLIAQVHVLFDDGQAQQFSRSESGLTINFVGRFARVVEKSEALGFGH